MSKKKYNFSLQQVEKTLQLKSWWASLVILPMARRLILFFANYTELSPNFFTSISMIFRITAAVLFATAKYPFMAAGAILFQLGYLADCIDGSLARLTGKTSTFGRYFDHMSDLCGGVLMLAALAYGQKMLFSLLTVGIIYIYVSEYYITLIVNLVLEKQENLSARVSDIEKNPVISAFLGYREFFFRRNFKSFLSLPDFEALALFIFPIICLPAVGLRVGFYFLVPVALYKIFSSFVTIQAGGRNFP